MDGKSVESKVPTPHSSPSPPHRCTRMFIPGWSTSHALPSTLHSVSDSIHAELNDSAGPGSDWRPPNPPRWYSESSGRSGMSLLNRLPALSERSEPARWPGEGRTTMLWVEREGEEDDEGEDEGVMSGTSNFEGLSVGMAPITTTDQRWSGPRTAGVAGGRVCVLLGIGRGETDRKHGLHECAGRGRFGSLRHLEGLGGLSRIGGSRSADGELGFVVLVVLFEGIDALLHLLLLLGLL